MNNDIVITDASVAGFCQHLKSEERSRATIEKYIRDVRRFVEFIKQNCGFFEELSKSEVIAYKEILIQRYEATSVNSMLAAINQYLLYIGKENCKVRRLKIQRQPFAEEEKYLTVEDTGKLLRTANRQGNHRLEMIIETLCSTGIRVSELPFITVERLGSGSIKVYNKGKTRAIVITRQLKRKLVKYADIAGIKSGPIFITRSGRCIDRSNLWREIKKVCRAAGVAIQKGFPHNFRHLFARCFYAVDKDLVNLADIMGHSNIETTRIYTSTPYGDFVSKLESMRKNLKICTT